MNSLTLIIYYLIFFISSHNEAGFEHIFQLDLPHRPKIYRDEAVNEEIWNSFKSHDGRISEPHQLKNLIFRGGIKPGTLF